MKVRMPKEWKTRFTYAEVEAARRIIKEEAEEDSLSAKEWADYAVHEALRDTGDTLEEIFTVTAEISRNCRVFDIYFDGSGRLDVWLTIKASTWNGYIECGAYLSDIWQTGAMQYKEYMYIRRAHF